jgi:predicted O-methyltransferase YrrM
MVKAIVDYDELFRTGERFGMQQKKQEIVPLLRYILEHKAHRTWCLEIGSYQGGTASVLSKIFDYVISIDISPEFEKGWNDIRRYAGNWLGIVGDSKSEIVKNLIAALDFKFDFIFIDGDHSFEGVLHDFQHYKKHLAPDGWVAFHDILDTQYHHSAGCYVDRFWQKYKSNYINAEFCYTGTDYTGKFHSIAPAASWGGIGLIMNAGGEGGADGSL